MVLSIAFFPPLSWMASALRDATLSPDRVVPSVAYVEACASFVKQSYRNRCRIATASGTENLSFPVVHDGARLITEVKVDYSTPWVERARRTVDSAYLSSPFYEYYRDDFLAVLEARHATLWDLDMAGIRFLLEKFHLAVDLRPTAEFVEPGASSVYGQDLREAIHPKRPNTILRDLGLDRPYYQVFAGRHGFQADLSCLDLLFNEGPDSVRYLVRL